jgi:hypothetical protein
MGKKSDKAKMIYGDDLRFDKHTKAVFDFATLFVHPQHYTTLKRELCLTELNFPMEEPPVFDGVLEEEGKFRFVFRTTYSGINIPTTAVQWLVACDGSVSIRF